MRARGISCSFTGHRDEKLPWGSNERDERCLALRQHIHAALEAAYAEGYRHFLCGMARGCDTYFCEEALALRSRMQDVTVEAVLPCLSQSDGWPEEDRQRYRELVRSCDYETVVQEQYSPGCMMRRNRYLVDHSSRLIAAYDGYSGGGTRRTVEYAFSCRLDVMILPISMESSVENRRNTW